MSAFVCILDRSGAPLEPGAIERLAEPLAGYGAELSTSYAGPVAIAVRHAGDPQARPRHGPLVDPASGRVVAVAGRFGLVDGAAAAGGAGAGAPHRGAAALALARLGGPRPDWGFLAGVAG
ncbi:MAG TPA: hypothetical protein VF100_03685, partial [Thermoanaerobaculia bacterium]